MPDWLWDGGRSSVDFVNTLRDRELGGRETLRSPADLAEWFRAAGLAERRVEVAEDDLARALRLRAAIDDAAFAVRAGRRIGPDDVALLNDIAGAVSLAPLLAVGDDDRPYARTDPSAAAALARVAVDAIELLTGGEAGRLRVCAALDCGIRFIDRSPARNRQWCSMRRCGNRAKARRHYARGRRDVP